MSIAGPRGIVLLLLGLGLGGCGSGPAPPSILLISVDTLRADHLSCYGYPRPTPAIDSLARRGVLYENAHAPAPWTLPSHMSLLTGRYPSSHGVVDAERSLPESVPQLQEALQRRGYHTAGFGAHVYLGARYGFERGFHHYELVTYRNDPAGQRRGDRVVEKALGWLERRAGDPRPFFLFVHLFDPHWTYAAPAPWLGTYSGDYQGRMDGTLPAVTYFVERPIPDDALQQVIALYDEEVAWTDALIGRLLEAVEGLDDPPLIALVADHGEEFKEHGSMGHAVTLYAEQSHVPLIVADPAGDGGGSRRVAEPVRTIDLVPTLAERAGVERDDPLWEALDGVPLDAADPALPVVIETTRWGPQREAVLVDGHKAISPARYHWLGHWKEGGELVREPIAHFQREAALYDLDADPGESRPLPWDPANPAQRALADWRERSWCGIEITFAGGAELCAAVDLVGALAWRDQPRLDDGRESFPVPLDRGRIELGGLPAGRRLRLHLPLEAAALDSLRIEVVSGSLILEAGAAGRRELGAGRRWACAGAELGDAAPLPPGTAEGVSRMTIRTRPCAELRAAARLSGREQELLRSLGYVDG